MMEARVGEIRRERPVIAIDGPVGAGKSTVARNVAQALGFSYLNTGAMYRAVAVAARDAGISPDDERVDKKIEPLLSKIVIKFEGEHVILSGRDITNEISTPEIGDLASRLSTLAVVRARMRDLQRAAGEDGGVVMEGRDIGTAVFPDAEFKFFLDAEVGVRAQRRWAELMRKGEKVSREAVLAQLVERDQRDRGRELAPLKMAEDAIVIDSTDLSIAQVVAKITARVETDRSKSKGLKRP